MGEINKKIILKLAVAFILVFVIIIPINYAKALENEVILTNDSNNFYKEIRQAINSKVPIFNKEICNEEQVNRFNELYKGYNKSKIEKSQGASVISLDSLDLKLKAIQISIEKNYDIYFYPEVPDKNKYESIISFGGLDISEAENISSENIDGYYDDMFKDSSLYVYIESEEYKDEALYMAVFRKGKIIFNLDEIRDDNEKYLAWFITPDKFNKDDYVTMYKRFRNLNGIGLLSENTKGTIMTLLNKSFYYDDLNLDKVIYSYNTLVLDNTIKEENDWKYVSEGQNLDNDILSKANFINICAHGGYNGFQMANGVFDRFPLMQAPIVVAESCENVSVLKKDNIALNAIENGAIAYVGSIKVGGVGGIYGLSDDYLGSYKDVPLSKVAKINTEFMLKNQETIPRVIIIGDPLFYFNRNEDFIKVDDNKVNLNSLYDLGISKLIYIDTNDKFKSIKNTSNDIKLDSNLKHYRKTNIVGVKGKNGTLEFSKKYDVMAEAKELILNLGQSISMCVDGFLIQKILIVVFLLALSPVFLKIIEMENPKAVFPIVFAIATVFIEKAVLKTSFTSIGRMVFYSASFIVVQNIASKKKYLYLLIAFIISLFVFFISVIKTINPVGFINFTLSVAIYYGVLVVIYFLIRKVVDFLLDKAHSKNNNKSV